MEALFQVQRSTRKTLPILDTNIPIYSKTFFRIKLPIQGWGWKETCLVLPEITSIKWICLRKIPLKRYSPHYQVDIPLGNSTNPGKNPPARWLCRKGTLQLEGWKNRSICKYIHHKSYTGVTGDNHLGVEIPFFKKSKRSGVSSYVANAGTIPSSMIFPDRKTSISIHGNSGFLHMFRNGFLMGKNMEKSTING